ncbi:MAG: DUF6056 family protein, partial [Lachnospiraceae bacterium]|nr:DUF6056 family protein [Lachnospiraceae bacterium]
MPSYMDDLWYGRYLRQAPPGYTDMSYGEALLNTLFHALTHDNARMANIVHILFCTLPKWIGSAITAILWGSACALSFRLLQTSALRTPLVCASLLLWSLFMPWYDHMGAQAFHCNYLISTFFGAIYLCEFIKTPPQSKIKPFVIISFGFVSGIWHEGFTIPILAMALCLYFSNVKLRTHRQLYLIAGLAAGLFWFMAWPCTWERLSNEGKPFWAEFVTYGAYILQQHSDLAILASMLLVCALKHRSKRLFSVTFFGVFLVGVFTSLALQLFISSTPRTSWCGHFCCVLAMLCILKVLFPNFAKEYTPRHWISCSILLAILFLRQSMIDLWSIRIGHNYSQAIRQHFSEKKDMIFTEMYDDTLAPLICLYTPDFNIFQDANNMYFCQLCYLPDWKHIMTFIPTELEYVTR